VIIRVFILLILAFVFKIDLVLFVIQIPNKNGYETINEIINLKNFENILIIAITAGKMVGYF